MDFVTHSHKLGLELFQTNSDLKTLWHEIETVIFSISEEEIIQTFNQIQETRKIKIRSLSQVINPLIKKGFREFEWKSESKIFQGNQLGNAWALDFAKEKVSVEVGFNHGSDAAWNVVKPTLASQINHVQKETETIVGVIVAAKQSMKIAGGFDNAIGTFEWYQTLLTAMQNMVTVPLVIIGLEAPKTFHIHVDETRNSNGSKKSIGRVVLHQP